MLLLVGIRLRPSVFIEKLGFSYSLKNLKKPQRSLRHEVASVDFRSVVWSQFIQFRFPFSIDNARQMRIS